MKDLYDDDPPFIDVALTLRNCSCGYLVVLAMYVNTLLMIVIHLRLGPIRREEEMQPILVTAPKKEKTVRHRGEKKEVQEFVFDKYQEVQTQDLSQSARKTLKMRDSYPEMLPLAKTVTETLSPKQFEKKKEEEKENTKEREIDKGKEKEKEAELEKVNKMSKEEKKDEEKLQEEKLSREQLIREKRLTEKETKEKASKEKVSKETASKEKGSKERGSKERGSKERGPKERGPRERALKDKGSKERGTKEKALREKDDKKSTEDKKGDRTLMSARMSIRLPRAPKGHHEEELEQMEKFLAEEDISAIEK